MNLVKERSYPIRRGERTYWVHENGKILREIGGGATAQTPNNAAQQAAATLAAFLSIAPRKYYTILGTVAAGQVGGSTSNVVWQQEIPIVPAFCTAIDYEIDLPVTLNNSATAAGNATLSPFAPYSGFANQLTLGGAPPWPLMEFTPWQFENNANHVNYDEAYAGLGGGSVSYFQNTPNGILDFGPDPIAIGGAGSLSPGSTASVPAGGSLSYTWAFNQHIKLQQKRHLLWGAVPFGDPENRPQNITQLYPIVGTLPEQSLFINAANGVTGAVTAGKNVTVKAVYELAYIDLLYPGMNAPPAPAVNYGLQITPSSTSQISAGAIFPVTHRTAQIYTRIHHILVNGGLPIRADYFALWDDQDQQSARWAYDSQMNTLNRYFRMHHQIYRRYPMLGHYMADLTSGVFPEIPSVTPYDALMTPDASYAGAFAVPVTPAMTTAFRVASGVALTPPYYLRNYEVGLVRVPY